MCSAIILGNLLYTSPFAWPFGVSFLSWLELPTTLSGPFRRASRWAFASVRFFPVSYHWRMFRHVLTELQGTSFFLSKWYKRSGLGLRTAVLSCGSSLSNAFGSLIASGILNGMGAFWDTPRGDGVLPSSVASRAMRSDLNRLFYLEGSLTIFTALVAAIVFPDFPSTSHHWLSPVEVRLAEKRMGEDALVLAMKVKPKSSAKGEFSLMRSRIGRLYNIHGIEVCHSLHSQRAHLTYPLRETSPVSSSPFHSMRSSPPSPLHSDITQL
jgi:hypothetical protein